MIISGKERKQQNTTYFNIKIIFGIILGKILILLYKLRSYFTWSDLHVSRKRGKILIHRKGHAFSMKRVLYRKNDNVRVKCLLDFEISHSAYDSESSNKRIQALV